MNHTAHFKTRIHLTRHMLSWRAAWRPDIVFLLTLALAWLTCALPLEAQQNTAFGQNALISVTSGFEDSAFGYNALRNDTSGFFNTAVGAFALQNTTTGDSNTGVGESALVFNQTGSRNTAVGEGALANNEVDDNTAVGAQALISHVMGSYNTALGSFALSLGNAGSYNTASGYSALSKTTGDDNTATGALALQATTTGFWNTATGVSALYSNTTGYYNVANGVSALTFNVSGHDNVAEGFQALINNKGSSNIGIGSNAGANLTTGNNNIVIGAGLLGVAGEANTTRIGKSTQAKTLIGGIYGKTVASGTRMGVMIDSTGKLGTVVSSARYKDNIKPMDKTSEAILALKPVTFRYKQELDPDKIPQFGLVAEEVEKVSPDLVIRGEDGKVMSVRYEAVNAMLLNEFLKEHRKVVDLEKKAVEQGSLKAMIAEQQKQIEALTAGLQKVTARVEAGIASSCVVSDN